MARGQGVFGGGGGGGGGGVDQQGERAGGGWGAYFQCKCLSMFFAFLEVPLEGQAKRKPDE